MKHEVLRMLKFINSDSKKLFAMLGFMSESIKNRIGKQKCGQERMDLIPCLAGILYYLRTNCTWRGLPIVFGIYQTIYGWFSRLCKLNMFEQWFATVLIKLVGSGKISLHRVLIDGSLATALKGGNLAKRTPRNRNKNSINRIFAVNGSGQPIGILLAEGSAHDSQFLEPMLEAIEKTCKLPKNFFCHGDKGFDSMYNRLAIVRRNGNARIPFRNMGFAAEVGYVKEKDHQRWKVERTNSWINKFKAVTYIFTRNTNHIHGLINLAGLMTLSKKLSLKDLKIMTESICPAI